MRFIILSATEVYDVKQDYRYVFDTLQQTKDFIATACLLNQVNFEVDSDEIYDFVKDCNP